MRSGADELAILGKRLKGADKQLRRDLLARIRKAGKPIIEDIKAGIHPSFPSGGGLSDRIAQTKIGVRTRLSGKSVGVRIQGINANLRTLRGMDESGTWRHPVFNTGVWVEQTYSPAKGWFSDPIKKDAPRLREAILRAVDDTGKRITRGL